MTGKEALEKLLDTLKHWQGRNTIFDKIHSKHILDELELLAKYKRAFEIFKRLINDKFAYIDLENGVFDGTIDITEEESELLEELMSDGL